DIEAGLRFLFRGGAVLLLPAVARWGGGRLFLPGLSRLRRELGIATAPGKRGGKDGHDQKRGTELHSGTCKSVATGVTRRPRRGGRRTREAGTTGRAAARGKTGRRGIDSFRPAHASGPPKQGGGRAGDRSRTHRRWCRRGRSRPHRGTATPRRCRQQGNVSGVHSNALSAPTPGHTRPASATLYTLTT